MNNYMNISNWINILNTQNQEKIKNFVKIFKILQIIFIETKKELNDEHYNEITVDDDCLTSRYKFLQNDYEHDIQSMEYLLMFEQFMRLHVELEYTKYTDNLNKYSKKILLSLPLFIIYGDILRVMIDDTEIIDNTYEFNICVYNV